MFLLLFLMWLILNGKVTLEIVILGLVLCAALFAFMCKFMDYSVKKEGMLYKRSILLIGYFFVLFIEIMKANATMIKLMFSFEYELEPVLVHFTSPLKSRILNAILANSITLTPGTITVSLEQREFSVHCLDKDLAEGMDTSIFVKLLQQMEG